MRLLSINICHIIYKHCLQAVAWQCCFTKFTNSLSFTKTLQYKYLHRGDQHVCAMQIHIAACLSHHLLSCLHRNDTAVRRYPPHSQGSWTASHCIEKTELCNNMFIIYCKGKLYFVLYLISRLLQGQICENKCLAKIDNPHTFNYKQKYLIPDIKSSRKMADIGESWTKRPCKI